MENKIEPTLAYKTSKEWNEIYKINILDPDGWDRTNYEYSFDKENITYDEFMKRVMRSTIEISDHALFNNPPFKLIRRDLPPVINLTETHGNAIYEIEHIRTRNNSLWMELLKIALEYAPVKTKEVLKQINENDNAVSKLLKGLIDD
ncbi:MAG: hypothetical protein WC346_17695 [Methanogenium sp.]|jgi:hypothetical protein